jgi:hypothetical protein
VGGTGWVAISYESGRVDVINARTERNPLAIGFTAAPPVGLATSDSDKGLFLAVAAGEVIWFRLPRPGDVAGWTATSRENPSSAGTSSNT